jgi:hypothetical protein
MNLFEPNLPAIPGARHHPAALRAEINRQINFIGHESVSYFRRRWRAGNETRGLAACGSRHSTPGIMKRAVLEDFVSVGIIACPSDKRRGRSR